MAINYSLSQRYAQPQVVNPLLAKVKAGTATTADTNAIAAAPKLWYASAQSTGNMTLEQFAAHISAHGSKYGKADVYAVLIQAVECLREQLLEGRTVSLGDLGSFSLSLQSEGTQTAAEFTRTNIRSINTNWSPGTSFANMLTDATFTQVLTKANSAILLKAQNGITLTSDEQTRLSTIQAALTPTTSGGGTTQGGGDEA